MTYHLDFDINRLRAKYEKEFKELPAPMREANMFCKWVEDHPVHIEEDDLFACWFGFKTREELDAVYPPIEHRPIDPNAPRPPKQNINWLNDYGFNPGGYDRAHHENSYKEILARGTDSYIEEVRNELAKEGNSEEKVIFLNAMLKSTDAIRAFSEKYVRAANEKKNAATNEADRARFERIELACQKLPMKAPEDFFEALQSAILVRNLTGISYATFCSVSYGAMDQYLYPYYKKSKEKGMSDDEVIGLLCKFYRMLDYYGGNDCAISVGGVDENDNDATNELSYLMVKAEKLVKQRSPLFAARINKNTPIEFLRELVSKDMFEIGQPSFYSEENCRSAVAYRGIPESEARNYQISTCMNLAMAGEEATHGWGCMVNTHLPLEFALNGGKPLAGEFGIELHTEPKSDYKNIDEIYDQYKSYLKELLDVAMEWNYNDTAINAKLYPNPFMALLTKGCIESGKDRWDGGARYHNLIMEMMAFANTADAFTAIDKLVFKEKKYTIAELVEAAKANYEGFEQIHSDIIACEKYGMNIDSADKNAARVLDIAAELCENMREGNRRYLPSLHTLWNDVCWPLGLHAFFDGRKHGEPVNKNAGPSTLARKAGPTAVALSACKIDQIQYNGGQALDVHIGLRNMDSTSNRDKIAAFIKTYFEMGGLHLQVNGLSVETLQKAYDDPAAYPDLLVRIGGHSRYFNEFDNHMKQKFIERFKIEEGAFS